MVDIKKYRKQKGVSQKMLADHLGVSPAIVSRYEQGTASPSIDRLQQIAEFLDVPIGNLINGELVEVQSERFCERIEEMDSQVESRLMEYANGLYQRNNSSLRKMLIAMARGKCELCGTPAPCVDCSGVPCLELHYIIPLSQGGTQTIDNSVVVCPNCNCKIKNAGTRTDIEKLTAEAKNHIR